MYIIVGLGNPGKKFEHTRHNAGFEALDFFAAEHDLLENEVMLFKPQTFMNESGKAVKEIMKNKNDAILIVVHDDIDVPLGKIKVSKGSSSGGHKGVASIIEALGTKEFVRIKIGVETGPEKAEEVVLEKFSPEQYEILQGVFPQVSEELEKLINENNK